MRIVGWRIAVLALACGPGIDGGAQDGSSASESSVGGPMTDATLTTGSSASTSDASTSEGQPDAGTPGPCAPAVFPDPELEQAVRESLEVDSDFVLTTESMQPLRQLRGAGVSIQDLRGLECATALVNVSFVQRDDARPDPNGVMDLTPLLGLPLLEGIRIEDQAISELMPFPSLDSLEVAGNPLSSIAELVGSDTLSWLDISDTPTTDLAPATQLPALMWLTAAGTPVTDIDVLVGSDELLGLYLDDTAVADLSVIPDLPALTSLAVNRSAVTDLSALAGSDALARLSINGTNVSELAVVDDLPALQYLEISDTIVSDLSALEGRALERLDAERILLDAFPMGLAARKVNLSGNGLTDPTPMATWEPPDEVDLADNEIEDLTPLLSMPWADLEFCVRLDLSGNPLSAPDTGAVVQDLCETLMIDIALDGELDCDNPDCPLRPT